MAYKIEEKEGYFLYEASGYITVQDTKILIDTSDKEMEKDPTARFLVDYSAMTGYEQKGLKDAYDRIDEGFPSGVKIALVYKKSGYLYYIIFFAVNTMMKNAKLFDDRDEAEEWLKET